jgi:hypothetical protein
MRHKTDHINDYLLDPANRDIRNSSIRRVYRIVCNSGLSFSAQAGKLTYCEPRSDRGPWQSVEIGYPSEEIPEFMPYVEDADHPLDTVYGNVPVSVVNRVLENNDGIDLSASRPKHRTSNPDDEPDYTGGMLYGYGINQMTPDPYGRTPNGPASILKAFEKDFGGKIANREKSGDWYVWEVVDAKGINAIVGELKDAGFYSLWVKHGKLGALRTHFSSR